MNELNHFDEAGQAHMVDIGAKAETERWAVAAGRIHMQAATFARIRAGHAAKGDVLGVARIAAIQGAKRTPELIPLAHPIAITSISVEFIPDEAACSIECRATVKTRGRTGVEMEALTAVAAGLLTIYDMVKAIDRDMKIGNLRLLEKHGGQSGDFVAST